MNNAAAARRSWAVATPPIAMILVAGCMSIERTGHEGAHPPDRSAEAGEGDGADGKSGSDAPTWTGAGAPEGTVSFADGPALAGAEGVTFGDAPTYDVASALGRDDEGHWLFVTARVFTALRVQQVVSVSCPSGGGIDMTRGQLAMVSFASLSGLDRYP